MSGAGGALRDVVLAPPPPDAPAGCMPLAATAAAAAGKAAAAAAGSGSSGVLLSRAYGESQLYTQVGRLGTGGEETYLVGGCEECRTSDAVSYCDVGWRGLMH